MAFILFVLPPIQGALELANISKGERPMKTALKCK
jgi:hypothetical protein